jgi:hypothetical protein
MLGRARKKRKIASHCGQVDAARDKADSTGGDKLGEALGPRQEEKGNNMRKREKTEHATRNPVQSF